MAWLVQVQRPPVVPAARAQQPLAVQVALVLLVQRVPVQVVQAQPVQPVAMVVRVAPLKTPVARVAMALRQVAAMHLTPAPLGLPGQMLMALAVPAVLPMAVLVAQAVL